MGLTVLSCVCVCVRACVRACVCVCARACVRVCVSVTIIHTGHILVKIKNVKMMFIDFVLHDLDLLFTGQKFES